MSSGWPRRRDENAGFSKQLTGRRLGSEELEELTEHFKHSLFTLLILRTKGLLKMLGILFEIRGSNNLSPHSV
jgi:hypothetical protein